MTKVKLSELFAAVRKYNEACTRAVMRNYWGEFDQARSKLKNDLAQLGIDLDLGENDPDYTRVGLFQTHNCWRCKDGKEPCVKGNPRNCDYLHARND